MDVLLNKDGVGRAFQRHLLSGNDASAQTNTLFSTRSAKATSKNGECMKLGNDVLHSLKLPVPR